MLPKTGSFSFPLESYLCDFAGKATLPLIGSLILQAAASHAQQRGFGYDRMTTSQMAWVLSRLSIEMIEYPAHNGNITIETWIETVASYFTRRCFRIAGHNNQTVGRALSIWAAISLENRRPVEIASICPELAACVETGKPSHIGGIPRIPPLKDPENAGAFTVRYSDIDINGHMNSIKYIEHMIDIFDLDAFRRNQIRKFDIAYLAEGMFADSLQLCKQALSNHEFLVDTKKDADSICRSRIVWENAASRP
jgi:acyl-ACP thioesterase